jgi:SusD family.
MKKIFTIIGAVSLMGLSSCKKFLETSSPSSLSPETVFSSSSMAQAAVMGLYGKMTDTYIYGQKLSVNWQGTTDIECNGSFSETSYNSNSSDYGAGNYYGSEYNATTRWSGLYDFAEIATATIDGIRQSPILESSAAKMKPLLGEALVLRTLAYFELVRYWGAVPFKRETSKSDLSNVYAGRTDIDTIYAYLVKDLQEAVTYLPWLGANTEYGSAERITKGFALGLLARVALFAGGWSLRDGNIFPNSTAEHHPNIPEQGGFYVARPQNWKDYYQVAVDACATLIGDPENPHQLDPSYINIWKSVCAQLPNPTNENLFEVAFGMGNNGDIGSLMGYNVAGNTKYGSRGFGGSYVTSTAYYFYSFDKEDSRRDATLTWMNYTSDNKEAMGSNPLSVAFAKWRIYWTSPAYLALHKTANSRIATGINWILMRYSDVYLMYAEAMNALHGAEAADAKAGITARQALEKVRERAFGPGSPKIAAYDHNDFFMAIVNERAWEFGCESIRKQDLIRWGLLYEKIEEMKKALCTMFDNKVPVTIFDKTYQPSEFPQTVYYKYKDAEYIDPESPNYYGDLPANPGAPYQSVTWFPKAAQKPTSGTNKNYIMWPVRVLTAATGLYPSYDYSAFLGTMTNGAEIQAELANYPMGNGRVYYRYPFAVYYEDVYESKGSIEKSYGY